MRKSILSLAFAILLSTSIYSCKEETKLDNLEDTLEDRSDDLEDASDEIGDVAINIEDALENFREALKEVENPQDREMIRKRVNTIFDEMEVDLNN